MRLAYSTNAYTRFDVVEAFERIARVGYDGVELMADAPHAWPADTGEAEVARIRDALERTGLGISNVNAFMMSAFGDPRHPYWHPSWIERDPAQRQVRIDHTIRALRLAAELGAPSVTTEPGGPLVGDMTPERGFDLFLAGLERVLPEAEALGVALLVEPEPGLLIERVDQTLALCDQVSSPAFGVNFDIGHLYCVSEPLPEAVGALSAVTRHYHVEDIAATRIHEHLVPGHGAIAFDAVFDAIDRTGYDGWITVELYPYVADPDGAGTEALAFLRRFAER